MRVSVRSFAELRDVIGNELQLEVKEGETIAGLLDMLCASHRGLHESVFAPSGTLKEYINVLKNGRNIAFLAGLATPLDDGDIIALFPPAAGG